MPADNKPEPIALSARVLKERAEIARRLKAGRWLAGATENRAESKGKAKGKVAHRLRELSPQDLAEREPLAKNGVTAGKIGATERMERTTSPMELLQIARALQLPDDWFSRPRFLLDAQADRLSADARGTYREQITTVGSPAPADGPTNPTPEPADDHHGRPVRAGGSS